MNMTINIPSITVQFGGQPPQRYFYMCYSPAYDVFVSAHNGDELPPDGYVEIEGEKLDYRIIECSMAKVIEFHALTRYLDQPWLPASLMPEVSIHAE